MNKQELVSGLMEKILENTHIFFKDTTGDATVSGEEVDIAINSYMNCIFVLLALFSEFYPNKKSTSDRLTELFSVHCKLYMNPSDAEDLLDRHDCIEVIVNPNGKEGTLLH